MSSVSPSLLADRQRNCHGQNDIRNAGVRSRKRHRRPETTYFSGETYPTSKTILHRQNTIRLCVMFASAVLDHFEAHKGGSTMLANTPQVFSQSRWLLSSLVWSFVWYSDDFPFVSLVTSVGVARIEKYCFPTYSPPIRVRDGLPTFNRETPPNADSLF